MCSNAAKLEEMFGVTFQIIVVLFNAVENLMVSKYFIDGGVGYFTEELHVF
jgi:hypothetical protein